MKAITSQRLVAFLMGLFIFLAISGCGLTSAKPKMEMAMAISAFQAANDTKAYIASPNLYRKAEFYFLKAKSAYRKKFFNKAKYYAMLAKKFSEEAESQAIRKATLESL